MPSDTSLMTQASDLSTEPFGQTLLANIAKTAQAGDTPSQQLPVSGYMGTTGKLAFFGDKILEGLQRGKVMAYVAEEAKRNNIYRQGLAAIESEMNDPNNTPDRLQKLQQSRDQWIMQHMAQEVGGGEDKPKRKDASERPSA